MVTRGPARRIVPTAGFTLVEVMFALAIFALAALAAVHVASEQISNTNRLEDRYLAQLVAGNRLAEVTAETRWESWPPENEASGTAELAGRSWFWEQQVLDTVTDDFREVTVRVRESEDGPVQAQLSTFVGRR